MSFLFRHSSIAFHIFVARRGGAYIEKHFCLPRVHTYNNTGPAGCHQRMIYYVAFGIFHRASSVFLPSISP